jgi:hypothetical protein
MLTLAQSTPYRLPKETRWPIQGLSPSALAVADFNEDGLPDLAVAYLRCDSQQRQLDPRGCPEEERAGRVVVFFSQGVLGRDRWSFSEKVQRLVVGDFPRSLAAGDLNNDGHTDIVVGNFGSGSKGSLSVFLNDGQGNFRSRPVSSSLNGNPKDIALGDFNNDGILDAIVALISTRRGAILLGDGTGDFAYPDEYQVGNAPQALAVGDFNEDGFLDAATANLSQSQSISILLNDKGGGFGAFTAARHIPVDDAPFDIVAADFNRDGLLDLATSHAAATDSVMIWLGDGQGIFQLFGRFEAGSDPSALAVADFNGDGFLDIAATNGGSSITMLFGDGQGQLDNLVLLVNNGNVRIGTGGRQSEPVGQLMDKVALPVGATPIAVVAPQFNRDRLADLIVANQTSHDISILLSRAP